MKKTLVLASNNQHKYDEFCALFPGMRILRPADFSLTLEVSEGPHSFRENAWLKAEALFDLLQQHNIRMPVIADDSGIALEALNGAPGVLSARYGADQGIDSDAARTDLMLQELSGQHNRKARYICAAILLLEKEQFILSQEFWKGHISTELRKGRGTGFGYDPIFVPEGEHRTVAEMTEKEKHQYSHRAKAVRTLIAAWDQSSFDSDDSEK